jgi:hypothetical protein
VVLAALTAVGVVLPGPAAQAAVVDSGAPKEPRITLQEPYSECTANACEPGGGPGVPATFGFAPDPADTGIVSYDYRLSGDATWSTTADPTVTVVPQHSGTYFLQVRARNGADGGRAGAIAQLDFVVAAGAAPVGRWHFDEDGGAALDSAATGAGTRHDATLSGGAVRDDRGRRGLLTRDAVGSPLSEPVTDKGLSLDGTAAYAATDAPVLDTRASYTLSAWVRLDTDAAHDMTALAQAPGTTSPAPEDHSPFELSYAGGQDGTWSMSVSDDDGTRHRAVAPQPSPRGVWTHVAGVFDAARQKVSLYLNGRPQATVDAGTPRAASGPLQIGRDVAAGTFAHYLQGSVDEVAVWQRVLTNEEIADEARLMTSAAYADVELVAAWSADQGAGADVPDTTSGYGRSLTLAGGASLDGKAIALDGVDGAAVTAGPVVDPTGSFTASALVSVDGAKTAAEGVGYVGQVLGQRSTDGSAWGLWYQVTGMETVLDEETLEEKTVPVGLWRFGRLGADGTFTGVSSEEVARVDTMVRLTGVFDAQAGTVALYVGDTLNGAASAFTPQAGTGEFAVGKGFAGGTWQHYLSGRVAEVRLWAGAMGGAQQISETVGD